MEKKTKKNESELDELCTISELAKALGVKRGAVDTVLRKNTGKEFAPACLRGHIKLYSKRTCNRVRKVFEKRLYIHTPKKIFPLPTIQNRLLSVHQVADFFELSTRTVFRLSAAGKFPKYIMIGGSKRWSLKTIEDWIDKHQ